MLFEARLLCVNLPQIGVVDMQNRIKNTVYMLITCLLAVLGFSATAYAQKWQSVSKTSGARGSLVCNFKPGDQVENFLCLTTQCKRGQPFSIGLLVTGGDFGNGEPMPVFVQVDTLKAHRVLMQPNKTQGILEAAVRYDAAKHRTLVDQLKQGSQVRIWTWNQNGTGVMVPLTGSAKAITRAMAVCGASAKQAAVRPEGSPGMLSAAAVRSQIIGKNLSFAGGEAEMILLSNGRFEGRMGPRANN
ncbi:MAG: hypothetical protein AAFO73_04740 [Pseudomonadota bacterium]